MKKCSCFTSNRAKLLIRNGIERYTENPYLKPFEYPENKGSLFEMIWPLKMPFIESEGLPYLCLNENNVAYVMLTDVTCECHLILALENGDVKNGVGLLYYRIEPSNGNIALKNFHVHEKYTRRGIGENLLFSMIRAEYRLLKTTNVYVHAVATTGSEKYLSQNDLEKYYENHGFVLCTDCYGGAYTNIPPNEEIREKLLNQMNNALTKQINHLE